MPHIRNVCCDSVHGKDFEIDRPNGYDCCLILFVKTKARFTFKGSEIVTEPNTLVCFNKYSPHKYGAYGGEYVNHWMHVELPAEMYSSMNAIFDRPVYVGSSINIDEYMHLISDAFYRGNTNRICDCLVTAMLEEIKSVLKQPLMQTAHFADLVELRKIIFSNPDVNWTVKRMAESIHVSEPYIQEIYKKAFGISCGADVICSRVEAAKILLADTEMTVAEIAAKCGYNGNVHFSRQFKKITGHSPAEYRKLML